MGLSTVIVRARDKRGSTTMICTLNLQPVPTLHPEALHAFSLYL